MPSKAMGAMSAMNALSTGCQRASALRRGLRVAVLLVAALAGQTASAVPAALNGVALVDQRGQPFVSTLQGKVVLLSFVFTQCASTCPAQTWQLARLHDALPPQVRQRVRFVSLTVDPLSDTPAVLAAYARRMQAQRAGWHFATGRPEAVFRLTDLLRIFPAQKGGNRDPDEHRSALFLFRSDGQLVQRFRGEPIDEARLADELTALADPRFIEKLAQQK